MDEQLTVNEDDMINFIQDELLKQGIIVKSEDIGKILDLEMKFLVKVGIAEPMEGEEQ